MKNQDKQFAIISVSRRDLDDLGCDSSKISDSQMLAIAERMEDDCWDENFQEYLVSALGDFGIVST